MDADRPDDLEGQIGLWRTYVLGRSAVDDTDVEELEGHLRDQITELGGAGLSDAEAFLVAVRRMGDLDRLSREFAREHSDRLWKQLVLTGPPSQETGARARNDLAVMAGCAMAAAVAIKLPALFVPGSWDDEGFYLRNLALFVLPVLAGYLGWRRGMGVRRLLVLVPVFVAGAVFANVYPFTPGGATEILTGLHLPIVLWLAVGVAHAGGEWRSDQRRMDFVRFTGEWFIYYVLIALGGGVLIAFTLGTFGAIGIDAAPFVESWLLPCGAMGAVIVAAWLVEAKQAVIENMAPVLTRVFTPLFAVMLVASVVAMAWTGNGLEIERDVLILFDLLLVLVLGLLLYAISARDPLAPPATMDLVQLVLVVAALVIDGLALAAILGRITDFGFSANKTAALGLNLILLVNLAWSAVLSYGFLRRRRPFSALESWQTGYVPVYGVWAAVVVVAFPPLFGFA